MARASRPLSCGHPFAEFTLSEANGLRAGSARAGAGAKRSPDRKQPQTNDQLQIVSMTLRRSEDITVGRRLREILSAARKAAHPTTG